MPSKLESKDHILQFKMQTATISTERDGWEEFCSKQLVLPRGVKELNYGIDLESTVCLWLV